MAIAIQSDTDRLTKMGKTGRQRQTGRKERAIDVRQIKFEEMDRNIDIKNREDVRYRK